MIRIRLLRNATLIIEMSNKQLLVDPLLGEKGAYDPVPWTSNGIRNPLTDLPVSRDELEEIIEDTDAVLVTHTHNDHWDEAARRLLPKDILLLGQAEDEPKFIQQGFEEAIGIPGAYQYEEITFTRTGGRHGTGDIAAKMAPVSGFILDNDEYKLYITGDTVWCDEVEEAISQYEPDFIILNAGGAQFDIGDPITMTVEDILKVCETSYAEKIICVHMEAINHCYLQREELRRAIRDAGFQDRCLVPDDGEEIILVHA